MVSGQRSLSFDAISADSLVQSIDVSEPLPVDDAYITEDAGVQAPINNSPSVMAGFVASIRLHTVLERA